MIIRITYFVTHVHLDEPGKTQLEGFDTGNGVVVAGIQIFLLCQNTKLVILLLKFILSLRS